MVEYTKVNVKSSDTQLKKTKAVKNKTGTMFNGNVQWKCSMEMICLMNCYWQQDKKQS